MKLAACPAGDFPVSDDSLYRDATWRLTENNIVTFEGEVAGINDLKRAIMFHVLPEYNPWGWSRSHSTTRVTGYAFGLIETYVFSDNKLNATAEQIAAVDATKLTTHWIRRGIAAL
ncbi:MAG: hypothetical protein CPSOU_2066 [uncultured Paraburkholderia sp.]|nr:MAG: hypothetical protein CPSOU_2066 [uncultured Paraburkholderia sp.]